MRTLLLTLAFIFGVFTGTAGAGTLYDFDGDGRADFTVRRMNGVGTQLTWFILQSRDGFLARQWGHETIHGGDGQMSADYDGDGKWDIGVIRGLSGSPAFWYVLNSSDGSMTAQHWGLGDDYFVPQDYDADGKTDFAVYREGWWYILRSGDGQFEAEKFGTEFDYPIQGGDYDGDGKEDLAVIRDEGGNRRQYIRYSGSGSWGKYALGSRISTGVVTGDYDGDGKADVAIIRGNDWLWERSSDGELGGLPFGLPPNDVPVPSDYDGDGKTDPAVFRPGTFVNPSHYFYVQQSRDGFLALQWGIGSDAYLFDHRYLRPLGARPADLTDARFKDRGPFPRLIEKGR